MGKRTAADLLPSWLGGPEGEVESPVALVLVGWGASRPGGSLDAGAPRPGHRGR